MITRKKIKRNTKPLLSRGETDLPARSRFGEGRGVFYNQYHFFLFSDFKPLFCNASINDNS
jgi:hypothetical protein